MKVLHLNILLSLFNLGLVYLHCVGDAEWTTLKMWAVVVGAFAGGWCAFAAVADIPRSSARQTRGD